MKKNSIVLLIVSLFLINVTAQSQGVFRSRANGAWNVSSTWTLLSGSDTDGIPDADDNVTITTHDVTIAANQSCNNLTVNSAINFDTAFFKINAGITLAVNGAFSINGGSPQKAVSFNLAGTIQFGKTVVLGNTKVIYTITSGSTIEYNGTAQTVFNIPGSVWYDRLILSGSGIKTFRGGITVNSRLSVRGSAQPAGSAIKYGTAGVLEYLGTSRQTCTNSECGATRGPAEVIVNNASGVVLNANKSMKVLTLTSGELSLSTYSLTISSTITRATGQINAASGTLVLGGTSLQTIPSGTLAGAAAKNITINNAAGVVVNESVAISGLLQVNTGRLLKPAPLVVFSGTGKVLGSGTIQVTRASGGNNLSTQYALSRTLTNLTVEYAGASIQSADAITYPRLKINNSNDVLLAGNTTVSSAFTLTSGCLRIAGNTLTVNCAITRTAGFLAGSHTSGLVLGNTVGNLYFSQTGTDNYLKVLTLKSASKATLANALNITGGTTTGTEGLLTVTGTGVLTSAGFLTIKSNQFGTASIAAGNTAGGYIVGDVTVERFIPQNASKSWRMLASNTNGQTIHQAWQEGQVPLANAKPGFGTMIPGVGANLTAVQSLGFDSLSSGSSLYKYNTTTDNLEAVTNTNATAFNSQPGYFLFIRGNRSPGQMGAAAGNTPITSTTLRSTGTLFLGNQPAIAVPANKQVMIRNPFPSAIDLRRVTVSGGVVRAFKVWDPKLNGSFGTGAYQTFTRVGTNYLVTPGSGSFGVSGTVSNILESGLAFFVQAVGTAGTVTITESCKVRGSRLTFRPTDEPEADQLLITNLYTVRNNVADLVDGSMIVLDDAMSDSLDIEDVKKSNNFGENIGIFKDSNLLVVEKRPSFIADDTIAFRIAKMKRSSYKLQILPVNINQPGLMAVLLDRYLGTTIPLQLADSNWYNFTVDANAASGAVDRFSIVFRSVTVLPVRFSGITATPQQGQVAVKWQVASQTEAVRYEVQHSFDGSTFRTIGNVDYNGTSGISTAYQYNHLNPVPGTLYYRIMAIEPNGTVQYSAIAKATVIQRNQVFTVSPNPARGNQVNIDFINSVAGEYGIQIINTAGQVCAVQKGLAQTGANHVNMRLPNSMVAGVYQLVITTPGKQTGVQKLIISPGQ